MSKDKLDSKRKHYMFFFLYIEPRFKIMYCVSHMCVFSGQETIKCVIRGKEKLFGRWEMG